jgi:hypothetical protein
MTPVLIPSSAISYTIDYTFQILMIFLLKKKMSVLALKNTQTTFFVREGNLVRHFFLNCEGQKKRIKKIPDFQVFWFTFLIDKSKSSENEYL